MTRPDLDAIQARADAATEGPWVMALDHDRTWALVLHDSGEAAEGRIAHCGDDDNAEFIALRTRLHTHNEVDRLTTAAKEALDHE